MIANYKLKWVNLVLSLEGLTPLEN